MLAVGNAVHLLIPSTSKKRILYPGQVIESDPIRFVAKFEDPIAPPVDSDVNAFCEVNGKFFQQGAVVTEIRPGQENVIAFRRNGEPVSAESRQTYRVTVVSEGFTVRLDKLRGCSVVDISPEGFAAVVTDRLNLGSVMKIKLNCDDKTVESSARVQSVKDLPNGQFRHGLLVPRGNISARNELQKISADMQRLQLKRLRSSLISRHKRSLNRRNKIIEFRPSVETLTIDKKRRRPIDPAPRTADEITFHPRRKLPAIQRIAKPLPRQPQLLHNSSSMGRLSEPWFSKIPSCISQNFPFAPAYSAVSAAASAFGWISFNGKFRNTNPSRLPKRFCTRFTIG